MKKLMIVALLFASAFVGKVAFAGIPEPDNAGIKLRLTGDVQTDPVRVYKLVRNASRDANTGGIASTDVCVYNVISDDGVTVTLTLTSADTTVAGIAVTAIATSDAVGSDQSLAGDWGRRNWGWIQVYGPTFARVKAGGTNGHVAGGIWYTSSDLGCVTGVTTLAADSGSVTTAQKTASARGGFFFDAVTVANTQEEVFVNLE